MTEQKKSTPKKEEKDVPLIFPKLINVMRNVGKIGKDRENPAQHYAFRGIDDVYNELHDVLATEGVITVPEVLEERAEDRESSSGKTAIYRILKIRYRFCAEDGSYVDSIVIGEGMDWGDKAANKAMSVAHKYAFLQIFCIPTAEPKDPEQDSIEAGKKTKNHGKKKGENEKSYPVSRFIVGGEEKLLTQFQALELFKIAKEKLGDEMYYKILNGYGFEKSNEIPLENMAEVREEMVIAYQERIAKTKEEKKGEKK